MIFQSERPNSECQRRAARERGLQHRGAGAARLRSHGAAGAEAEGGAASEREQQPERGHAGGAATDPAGLPGTGQEEG